MNDPSREINVATIDVTLDDLERGYAFLEAVKRLEDDHTCRIVELDFSVEREGYTSSGTRFKLRRAARQARTHAALKLVSFRGRLG